MDLRSQRFAQLAYDAVKEHAGNGNEDKYLGFSRAFPTLLHTCGLAQSTSFAQGKGGHHLLLLEDLATAMGYVQGDRGTAAEQLLADARTQPVPAYMRLSRQALEAAAWLKRYAEALLKEADQPDVGGEADASN